MLRKRFLHFSNRVLQPGIRKPNRRLTAQDARALRNRPFLAPIPALAGDNQNQAHPVRMASPDESRQSWAGALHGQPVEIDTVFGRDVAPLQIPPKLPVLVSRLPEVPGERFARRRIALADVAGDLLANPEFGDSKVLPEVLNAILPCNPAFRMPSLGNFRALGAHRSLRRAGRVRRSHFLARRMDRGHIFADPVPKLSFILAQFSGHFLNPREIRAPFRRSSRDEKSGEEACAPPLATELADQEFGKTRRRTAGRFSIRRNGNLAVGMTDFRESGFGTSIDRRTPSPNESAKFSAPRGLILRSRRASSSDRRRPSCAKTSRHPSGA